MRKPRNYGNPGAFDYAHYLARQEIYWTASGAAGNVRILPGRCGSPFQNAVMDLRQAALARIERLYHGDSYQTGMMQAILIGQSFQLQRVWTEKYRNTGTFHALVISGTHVAILAAFFLFLLRLCFVPESLALLLTVVAAWLYALVTGWGALRALRGGSHAVHDRQLLLSRTETAESAGGNALGFLCSIPASFSKPASSSRSWPLPFWGSLPRP